VKSSFVYFVSFPSAEQKHHHLFWVREQVFRNRIFEIHSHTKCTIKKTRKLKSITPLKHHSTMLCAGDRQLQYEWIVKGFHVITARGCSTRDSLLLLSSFGPTA
jgi:hypothetical protein